MSAENVPAGVEMMRAGIALGSNLGDRLAALKAARAEICTLSGVEDPVIASPIYETDPVGCEPGAGAFLNAVIELSYAESPLRLFNKLREVEVALGRPASHIRNVSRPIDIDLLYFGDFVIAIEQLTVPHPRIYSRRFVLQPLADIRPDLILPGQTKTVRELLTLLSPSAKVVRSTLQWEDH